MLSESLFRLAERLPEFSTLISFLAPFVGGEVAILTLGFFAGQGTLPLLNIIIGSALGMITLDSFWFLIMRSPFTKKIKNRIEISEKYKKLESKIEMFSQKNDIAILLVSKILIGTRILALAYISIRKISFQKFILFDGSATLLWAIILGCLGWFSGLGFYTLSTVKHNVAFGSLYISITAIIIYSCFWLIRRWIIKG